MLKIKSKKLIEATDISGGGGKESMFIPLFKDGKESLRRVNNPLYDAETIHSKHKIEFKKQVNDQWFDLSKYYKLTEEEKNITMVFVLHIDGKIDKIGLVGLGSLLERLVDNEKYIEYGWTSWMLRTLYTCKKSCPKIQAKGKLKVRNLFRDELDIIKVIYERK